MTTENETLLQQARNIVADAYLANLPNKGPSFDSFEKWRKHVDDWTCFMRRGAYDDDLAVVATLVALKSNAADQAQGAA